MSSLSFAQTSKPIKIDSLEEVMLGGLKQSIYINSNNTSNNPILLILHGGPGYAMLPLFHTYNFDLENKFTVVNWDQRGAGKSYSDTIPTETMTLNQLIADAHELTLKLKARFKQDKIYLLGHSSGTMIGILLAAKYPEDYHAYIGVGQVVSAAENESMSYKHVLNHAILTQNATAIKELKQIGAPDSHGQYKSNDDNYAITEKWIENFGAELYNKKDLNDLENDILGSNIYKNNPNQYWQAYYFSQRSLFKDKNMINFNAEATIPALKIPVYFVSGKYDYDTPVELVKRYYQSIQAPKKAFIEFQKSAHFPFYEEPEQFNAIMLDTILNKT
jgi:pimeloyl-ACP methyl ester carboxylesterase